MSKYVQNNLCSGESIIYQTRLHWVIFWWSFIFGVITAGIGLILTTFPLITYFSSEFAVTTRRLIVKIGWFSQRTVELNLLRVESVSGDQGLLGRILDYGTVTFIGTGGTRETFETIANPLAFRKAVLDTQDRLLAVQDRHR